MSRKMQCIKALCINTHSPIYDEVGEMKPIGNFVEVLLGAYDLNFNL